MGTQKISVRKDLFINEDLQSPNESDIMILDNSGTRKDLFINTDPLLLNKSNVEIIQDSDNDSDIEIIQTCDMNVVVNSNDSDIEIIYKRQSDKFFTKCNTANDSILMEENDFFEITTSPDPANYSSPESILNEYDGTNNSLRNNSGILYYKPTCSETDNVNISNSPNFKRNNSFLMKSRRERRNRYRASKKLALKLLKNNSDVNKNKHSRLRRRIRSNIIDCTQTKLSPYVNENIISPIKSNTISNIIDCSEYNFLDDTKENNNSVIKPHFITDVIDCTQPNALDDITSNNRSVIKKCIRRDRRDIVDDHPSACNSKSVLVKNKKRKRNSDKRCHTVDTDTMSSIPNSFIGRNRYFNVADSTNNTSKHCYRIKNSVSLTNHKRKNGKRSRYTDVIDKNAGVKNGISSTNQRRKNGRRSRCTDVIDKNARVKNSMSSTNQRRKNGRSRFTNVIDKNIHIPSPVCEPIYISDSDEDERHLLDPNIIAIDTDSEESGYNIYDPLGENKDPVFRTVVIDGDSVAHDYEQGSFSFRSIALCIQFFLKRGHKNILAFLSSKLQRFCYETEEQSRKINEMRKLGYLTFVESNCGQSTCFKNRYMIQFAIKFDGVIVTNNSHDYLKRQNPKWASFLEKRALTFTWINGNLIFHKDPQGRNGLLLDDILKH